MSNIIDLEPGLYYFDVLADGTVTPYRENFPTVTRTSFDTRPPVVETRQITVEVTYSVEKPLQPPSWEELKAITAPPDPQDLRAQAERLFDMPKQ